MEFKKNDPAYIHYVAKDKETVLGVILVQIDKKQKPESKIPLLDLMNSYGIINVTKIILKMSSLESSSFKENYIEHLAVSSRARGQGIGSLLLLRVEEDLLNTHAKSLTLAVTKDNPAQHLYKRHGFEIFESKHSFIKDKLLKTPDWYYMRKTYC